MRTCSARARVEIGRRTRARSRAEAAGHAGRDGHTPPGETVAPPLTGGTSAPVADPRHPRGLRAWTARIDAPDVRGDGGVFSPRSVLAPRGISSAERILRRRRIEPRRVEALCVVPVAPGLDRARVRAHLDERLQSRRRVLAHAAAVARARRHAIRAMQADNARSRADIGRRCVAARSATRGAPPRTRSRATTTAPLDALAPRAGRQSAGPSPYAREGARARAHPSR